MKTVYRVRRPSPCRWQSTHDTLEQAIAFAKQDKFFKDSSDTFIEKIVTERVWKNTEESK